jgi:hypothetical protein
LKIQLWKKRNTIRVEMENLPENEYEEDEKGEEDGDIVQGA